MKYEITKNYKYNKEFLFQKIKKSWDKLGYAPSLALVAKDSSLPVCAFVRVFGKWSIALKEFCEWANKMKLQNKEDLNKYAIKCKNLDEKVKVFKRLANNKKLPDYECDHDGRVMRINNWNSSKIVYCSSEVKFLPCLLNQEQKLIEYCIDQGLCFEREEDCKAHEAKKIVEIKLRNIAYRLNDGMETDWEDHNQAKYVIGYNLGKPYKWPAYEVKTGGAIYCLSKDFLEEAIKELGEEELIKYLKGN